MQLTAVTVQRQWAEAKGTSHQVLHAVASSRVRWTPYEMTDEKVVSLAHTLLIQGCPGSITSLRREHWVQSTLWLYVVCDQQPAEFLLMKANFENSWAPHPGFEPRPSAYQSSLQKWCQILSNTIFVSRQMLMFQFKMAVCHRHWFFLYFENVVFLTYSWRYMYSYRSPI